MQSRHGLRSALCVGGLLLLASACTDTLPIEGDPGLAAGDGLQFSVTTREMGDLTIGLGSTRAGRPSAEAEAAEVAERAESDAFTARDMAGDNPYGLSLHRLPLPYVGIHRKAVHGAAATAGTRASVDEIVKADGSNFHDSISIWGYTDKAPLFDQTLLKQIQGWRSAVLWPYDKTSPAEDRPQTMRFYALAPSAENLNISVLKDLTEAQKEAWGISDYDGPSHSYAPVFRLTLPETVDGMRDVLYGQSEIISVQAGPSGSVTDDPEDENLGQDNKRVLLTFGHIMTAIRFAQGGTFPAGVTVQSIRLKNIAASGIFNPNKEDEFTHTMGDWSIAYGTSASGGSSEGGAGSTPTGVRMDYELTGLQNQTSGSNTYIDGQQVMFMIPQTLEGNEELEVTLLAPKRYQTDQNENYEWDDAGHRRPAGAGEMVTHTVSCPLKGDIWKKGYTVTYRLTIGELMDGYYLMVEAPAPLEHNSAAKMSGTFTVHSYRSCYNYSENPLGEEVTTHGVDWEIVGYYTPNADEIVVGGIPDETLFDEKKPEWFSIDEKHNDGFYEGGYGKSVEFTLLAATHKEPLKFHSTSFQRRSAVNFGEGETANCYIVNGEDTEYFFPLVYGNKTEDGDEDPGIVDHRGNLIAYRHIKDQIDEKYPDVYTQFRAQIIWQDVAGLIKDLALNYSTTGNISFTTNADLTKNGVAGGNAVIALQAKPRTENAAEPNSSEAEVWETLWTWHIWLTDEVTPVTLENYEGERSEILPVNLGWVPKEDAYGVYEPREVWMKIQQVRVEGKTPASAVVRIRQEARQDTITGTSTIYQWGRPTALPMTLYSDGTNTKKRKIYDSSGDDISDSFTLQNVQTSSGDGYHIANPTQMFRWSSDTKGKSVWFDMDCVKVPEYWSEKRKTVYDPCPPGYRVPPVGIFTGLSRTGANSLYGSQLNVYPDVAIRDANGKDGVASNTFYAAGGYFYTKRFVSEEDMDAKRYDYPLVYFPVTGEWQGDVPSGTPMNGSYVTDPNGEEKKLKTNDEFGFYWCADYDSADKLNASALWICPWWGGIGTDSKPIIQFGRTIQYSSAQPIRPMQFSPATSRDAAEGGEETSH